MMALGQNGVVKQKPNTSNIIVKPMFTTLSI